MQARWIAALLTLVVIALYEIWLSMAQRRRPQHLARSAHATLREEWFDAVSRQPGSEVLAVQTLRNSLMSSSMIASTAVLGLMGTITLSAPSLNATFGGEAGFAQDVTPRLALELILIALLFACLVSSVMAMRYFNHAGFIVAMPVNSEARLRWDATGSAHLRRAGMLYSWSLRNLVLVVPVVASILHSAAGPIAAAIVVIVLSAFDRVQVASPRESGDGQRDA